jgi:hypothetical protein
VKLADCWLVDVILSGVIGNFLVNDVDVTAFVEPSSNEVLEARRDRIAVVRRVVDPLTDDELERVCTRSPRHHHLQALADRVRVIGRARRAS